MIRVGVIGGGGWLAGTLLRPALAEGVIRPEHLILSSRRGRVDGFEAWPGIGVTADNAELAARSDVVILSVRPTDLAAVSLDLADKLVISMMASVTAADIAARFGASRIIRAMPNACAEQRQSFTPWFATDGITEEDSGFARRFLAASGIERCIPDEAQIDYFTALTGSGAAFPALIADIMARHATSSGIDPDIAEAAVRQLMLGAGTAIARAAGSPADIVKAFVDYRGTTAAGLNAMTDHKVAAVIEAGLNAAWAKARGD